MELGARQYRLHEQFSTHISQAYFIGTEPIDYCFGTCEVTIEYA